MDSIIIQGGKALIGDIIISGSKNAALPIMAATLLTGEEIIIDNIPKLADIYTMKQLLAYHGASIAVSDGIDNLQISIKAENIHNFVAPYDIVRKMRASIWVLAPLLARFGHAEVSLPGGCAIGLRQVDLHIAALEAMGATIEVKNGLIHAKVLGKLQGTNFTFSKISVGATITAITAAVLANGTTTLSNCAKEPEIVDLCHCLIKMGAEINGVGTRELKIIGKPYLNGTKYRIIPDRIEAGTYMIAAAMTKGNLNIKSIDPIFVDSLCKKLDMAGLSVQYIDNGINVKYLTDIHPVNIETEVFPGFPTDLQAQFMSLMTISDYGTSIITENIFENRFMHVPELCRMGAEITVDGRRAIIKGSKFLTGAEVMASDLRASVSLILAGLVAIGETKVKRIYHLDRGYQFLEKKLSNCGADIQRVSGDMV